VPAQQAGGSEFRKVKKKHQNWKEEVMPFLLADDMGLYVENNKESIRKLLELTQNFIKGTVYKINSLNSFVFLSTNNE
jgi:hypothetical protein